MVLIDESTQSTEPECMVPIVLGAKQVGGRDRRGDVGGVGGTGGEMWVGWAGHYASRVAGGDQCIILSVLYTVRIVCVVL